MPKVQIAQPLFVAVFIGAATIHPLADALNPERSEKKVVAQSQPVPEGVASKSQLNDWINDALKVMKQEGIPGSYNGIHRNIIRESGGNPTIVNDYDINAKNGTPSKGLLQVIQPTFDAHKLPQSAYDKAGVQADANKLTDPVANIVTACNYAASRYGSMDNVNGPY